MVKRSRKICSLFLAVSLVAGSFSTMSPVSVKASETTVSLIPENSNQETPNYVCTWSFQDWAAYSDDYAPVRNGSPRAMLNHEQLFGENGWITSIYPEDMRGDLIYLLDDGWDLPYGDNGNYFGSHIVDPQKFPNYGDTPEERLKTLVSNIENAGWKGAGIWICANEMSGENNKGWNESYWRERIEWSKYAGVDYWKIDWGGHSGDSGWRQLISDLADEIYPELVIEHITGLGTLNGSGTGSDVRLNQGTVDNNVWRASYSDVYRTYDVNGNLSIPTTFERIGTQLEQSYTNGRQLGLINGEDEVYMNSTLGLACGIMRYPIGNASSGSLPNIFFGGAEDFTETRPIRKMHDEVRRAVMWQRIAPAYRSDAYPTVLSGELSDNWYYESEDTWDTGRCKGLRTQNAPAIIARGIDVPSVNSADGQPVPFVGASRNPNGAVSIGTFGRTTQENGYQKTLADITLPVGALTGKIGVFGYYNSLTLTFDKSVDGKTIYAQDLMNVQGDSARDITDSVTISEDGKSVTFSGELLQKIGLEHATAGDFSEPGLVIQIGTEEAFEAAPATRYVPECEIPNSSFELTTYDKEKNDALVWDERIKSGTDDNFYVKKATADSPAHSGEYYGVQEGSSAYSGSLTYKMPYMKNGVYDISLWVKSSGHNIPSTISVSENGGESKTAEIPAADEWTKITIPGVVVSNRTCRLEIASDASAGEYIYFDDIAADMSSDINAVMDMMKSEIEKMYITNDFTEEALNQKIQNLLGSYNNIRVSVSEFTKTSAANDEDGKIVFKLTLENEGGKTEEKFELVIPKTSLVSNAGFELGDGETPLNWGLWNRTGGNYYREAKDQPPFAPHSGEWYAIKYGRNFDDSIYQVVGNLENGLYKASVWVRNTAFPSATASPTAACFVAKNYGGEMRWVDLSEGNADWVQPVIENINVTNGQAQVEIYTCADGSGTQWMICDDFNLERQDFEITTEDISNGTITVNKDGKVAWGQEVTVTAVPDTQYRLKDGTLKVYKTGEPDTLVQLSGDTFVMPQYPVTITAEFEAATPEKGYVVKVDGEEKARGEYNTKVTVTAPEALEGQKFTGWLLDGRIVSTSETYTFYISGNVELTTCYDAAETMKPSAMIANTLSEKRADTKTNAKFVAQLVVPENYTLKKAGLVWTTKADKELLVDGRLNPDLDPTYIRAISDTNQFSVTIKGLPAGMFIRGIVFAELEDENGETVFVFSEEKKISAVQK